MQKKNVQLYKFAIALLGLLALLQGVTFNSTARAEKPAVLSNNTLSAMPVLNNPESSMQNYVGENLPFATCGASRLSEPVLQNAVSLQGSGDFFQSAYALYSKDEGCSEGFGLKTESESLSVSQPQSPSFVEPKFAISSFMAEGDYQVRVGTPAYLARNEFNFDQSSRLSNVSPILFEKDFDALALLKRFAFNRNAREILLC